MRSHRRRGGTWILLAALALGLGLPTSAALAAPASCCSEGRAPAARHCQWATPTPCCAEPLAAAPPGVVPIPPAPIAAPGPIGSGGPELPALRESRAGDRTPSGTTVLRL
jgi:hypothetical protein